MKVLAVPSLFLNDIDLSTFGLSATVPQGWSDGPPITDLTSPVPGRAGVVRVSNVFDVGPKVFTVSGVFISDNLTECHALWDGILGLLGGGAEIEVRFADWPDRMALARYRSITWAPDPGFKLAAKFTLAFEMLNPFKLARQVDVYALPKDVAVPITLGSAASDITLLLIGLGLADPAVLYADAQGTARGNLSFTIPLASGGLPIGSWIRVDGEFGIPYQYLNGVVTNASALLADACVDFVGDPADRDATTGPTLTASNCTAVAYVRRAFR